jgi:hypothetical protein
VAIESFEPWLVIWKFIFAEDILKARAHKTWD